MNSNLIVGVIKALFLGTAHFPPLKVVTELFADSSFAHLDRSIEWNICRGLATIVSLTHPANDIRWRQFEGK